MWNTEAYYDWKGKIWEGQGLLVFVHHMNNTITSTAGSENVVYSINTFITFCLKFDCQVCWHKCIFIVRLLFLSTAVIGRLKGWACRCAFHYWPLRLMLMQHMGNLFCYYYTLQGSSNNQHPSRLILSALGTTCVEAFVTCWVEYMDPGGASSAAKFWDPDIIKHWHSLPFVTHSSLQVLLDDNTFATYRTVPALKLS